MMVSACIADALDHAVHASIARVTGGIAPGVVTKTYMDWLLNLAHAPGSSAPLYHARLRVPLPPRLGQWRPSRASIRRQLVPPRWGQAIQHAMAQEHLSAA